MTDTTTDYLHVRAAELVAAGVAADVIGWVAHRTASSRALALLDLMAERSGDPDWLAAAAHERGTRATTPQELRHAASQLTRALERGILPPRYQLLLVDLLVVLREDAQIAQLIADGKVTALSRTRRQMLDADLSNPFRTPGLAEQVWLDAIQPLFGDLGPVRLAPAPTADGHEPLDRLMADVEPGSARGALVSVIVSSYRPGPGLETAVRSILAQTWADVEILVVDDASGPEYSSVYARMERLDARVRVLHHTENGGTYVARNTAIDQAHGTYVTFQDADDWSHPARIELQVASLEQDPLVHSVRTQSLRTSGSLVFSRQGSSIRGPAAATLMFRRHQVWPVLGGYDTVRKAADTEFHERIAAALPGYAVDLQQSLLWVRLGEGSLSRNEFRAGWRHPARLLYRSSWAYWHEQVRLGSSPHLDRGVRRFPTPRRFRLDQQVSDDVFDVVILGDWRGDGNAARDAVDWIRLLATDGVRIGLVHVECLNFDGPRPSALMGSVQELVATGTVEAVPWDDPVKTNTLVAIEPEVLEFLPDTEPGARTAAMVVLLDARPRHADTIASTEAIVNDRWGSRVVWSPRGTSETGLPTANAEVLGRPFSLVMPGEVRRPLHRPKPVVVVSPIGITPEVLDETAAVSSALAEAGLDVRVRLAAGLRQAVRRRVGSLSPRIFWAASTDGAAAAELAVATDLVIIGTPAGIDFERLVEDARMWSVRTHVRVPAERATGLDDVGLAELVERIRAAGPPAPDGRVDVHARFAAEAAVRAWYQEVTALI